MPVRRIFPWAVIEDKRNECMLGVLLDAPSSWQIEVFSEDDRPAVSGGQAGREFGHWIKRLEPGERFESTKAEVIVGKADLDEIYYRLTQKMRRNLEHVPEIEKELPIIFNEFCASFVIDAGWHADREKG